MATPRQAIAALSPEYRPFHLPDFRPTLRVLDAVTLPRLLAEAGRIAHQVLHLTRLLAARQPRVLSLAAPTRRRAVAEHPWLPHPAVEVRRHFPHEYLATLFEAVQKGRVAPVEFVERPGPDAHAAAQGAVDHPQSDLWLGAEHDLVGYVTFFRRSGSSIHSWDR